MIEGGGGEIPISRKVEKKNLGLKSRLNITFFKNTFYFYFKI